MVHDGPQTHGCVENSPSPNACPFDLWTSRAPAAHGNVFDVEPVFHVSVKPSRRGHKCCVGRTVSVREGHTHVLVPMSSHQVSDEFELQGCVCCPTHVFFNDDCCLVAPHEQGLVCSIPLADGCPHSCRHHLHLAPALLGVCEGQRGVCHLHLTTLLVLARLWEAWCC